MKKLISYFNENNWEIEHTFQTKAQKGKYIDYKSLGLSSSSNLLLSNFKDGIYCHQWQAIKEFDSGNNVCISTSTSSGKTLVFNVAGIESLHANPKTKILAIYPLKALGSEQEVKWKDVMCKCGLSHKVGRIDGSVPQSERQNILKNASVVIMTPDVIHAWLLSNISSAIIRNFLKNIQLIVIDEAHTYSGVFGSNTAYLFRRLHHLVSITGGKYRYIAASATIKNPSEHLYKLTGIEFSIIDNMNDTSPKKKIDVMMVNPPKKKDMLSTMSELMNFIASQTDYRFLTFVDSRKQVEYAATISARKTDKSDDETLSTSSLRYFIKDLPVCPYRSGYEEHDRLEIQNMLTKGELKGVISTSALELGIDIPYLNLGILSGIPNSATSFYQRIGRIGRHQDGIIIILNDGSIQTEAIFRNPENIKNIPLSESTLYLENQRVQYIHTLCLARQGGEDETLKTSLGFDSDELATKINFPSGFIELCNSEKIGEVSSELQPMKAQAGDDPNHIFPLRDVDVQYKVECRRGPEIISLGSLSFSQVMREAYPGAVYYYQTRAYRVFRVNFFKKVIEVRSEKKYTTKPKMLPTLIFPNLSEGNILQFKKYGKLLIVECVLQIRESIIGYVETRGRNEEYIEYPLDRGKAFFYDLNRFTRNYFTTGIIINHPALNYKIKTAVLAEIIYEAFFMVIPFERQDIFFGYDKHRADRNYFSKDSKFISIFDQTYGSLRLTSKFVDPLIMKKVFDHAIDIAENDSRYIEYKNDIKVLYEIKQALKNKEEDLFRFDEKAKKIDSNNQKVIMKDSIGLHIKNGNLEEFFVEDIFYSPSIGLSYKGRHLSETTPRYITETFYAGKTTMIIPISELQEIPGESKIGYYNYETGDIVENLL